MLKLFGRFPLSPTLSSAFPFLFLFTLLFLPPPAAAASPSGFISQQDNKSSPLLPPDLLKSLADLEEEEELVFAKPPDFFQVLAGPLSSAPGPNIFVCSATLRLLYSTSLRSPASHQTVQSSRADDHQSLGATSQFLSLKAEGNKRVHVLTAFQGTGEKPKDISLSTKH